MSFISRIMGGFKRAKQHAVEFVRASGIRLSGLEDVFDAHNIRTFKDSLYLFIGVSMIRETVSSTPLELYRIKNKMGDTEEIMDSEWIDLLTRPNSRQTQKEFMKLAISYYLLAGEAFWYLEREGNGIPTAMANIRPDCMNLILSDAGDVVAYEYTKSNGEIVKLPPNSILHIKNIDPSNPIRGIGVVRPATVRIIAEQEAAKYQSTTFRNQGRLDIAIFVDQELSDEEATEARSRWKKNYSGEGGSSVGFFGNQVKDLKQLNVSPKEMSFIESMKFLRDDILAALRIPKQMIDTDVNYNNSQVAYAQYVRQACEPVLDAFLDVINNKMILDTNPDLFFAYESHVGEDRELKLKEATEGFKVGLITRDEGRDILGFAAAKVDGDKYYEGPQTTLQLAWKRNVIRAKAVNILKTRRNFYRTLVAREAVSRYAELKFNAEHKIQRQRNPVFATDSAKTAYINAFNNNIDKKAVGFHKTIDVYNDGLANRIIEHFEKIGVSADGFLNAADELRIATNIFLPLMTDLYTKVGDETMDSIANGFKLNASERFYTHAEVLKRLEKRANFFVGSMLDTDYEELKKVIADGMKDGLGVPEMGRKIRNYFDDMSVSRAKTIARTETGRVVSEATLDAYQQSAVVTGVQWLTAGDTKVRDEHKANGSAGVLAVGAAFPSGEHYPGESSINCRCALAPSV